MESRKSSVMSLGKSSLQRRSLSLVRSHTQALTGRFVGILVIIKLAKNTPNQWMNNSATLTRVRLASSLSVH